MGSSAPPIIIKRKKAAHGGHHGGAWKVAYADFVTAMMALFIVLWLMNTSKQIQEAVGGYFKDPTGSSKKVGRGETGSGDSLALSKDNLSKLKEELEKTIRKSPKFDKLKDNIEFTLTPEGLRIELLESATGTFFRSGAAEPTESGKEILIKLAEELGKLPNQVSIEGHTDSKPFTASGIYSNWELSADRANMARRLVQENGLGEKQVTQVRGYADQRLRKPLNPEDPSNRRISLIVQYIPKTVADETEQSPESAASGKASETAKPVKSH
ncbi:MAG: OmpA family protein [Acidobacteriia bacterium]|nr:OmpA family protein [Terriglobia bacterium]